MVRARRWSPVKPKAWIEFLLETRRRGLEEGFVRICHAGGVSLEQAFSRSRLRARTSARANCYKWLHDQVGMSWKDVAQIWARDETSVRSAAKSGKRIRGVATLEFMLFEREVEKRLRANEEKLARIEEAVNRLCSLLPSPGACV